MVTIQFDIPDDALKAGEHPRHKPMLTYSEAGDLLGISKDGVAKLVDAGVLIRPDWTIGEVRTRLVTTSSVYAAAGWPVLALAAI